MGNGFLIEINNFGVFSLNSFGNSFLVNLCKILECKAANYNTWLNMENMSERIVLTGFLRGLDLLSLKKKFSFLKEEYFLEVSNNLFINYYHYKNVLTQQNFILK